MLMWYEIVGWAAAVVVVVALTVPSIVVRRILLIAAAAFMLVYATMVLHWPVAAIALAVAVSNALGLRRDLTTTASDIAAVPIEPHAPFLEDFLRANLPEIHRSQPEFSQAEDAPFVRLITRHGLPAGVFLGRPEGSELHVVLDYVTPRYRDSRSGRWLFGQGKDTFTSAGFKRLVASPTTYEHQSYLEGLGFVPEGNRMVKEL